MNILITGGAGFIGSHVVRYFVNKYPEYNIFNLDKLTYAGNLENLRDIESSSNYTFIRADICEFEKVKSIYHENNINAVIHLAAESHVDRSIENPMDFIYSNIIGTVNLMNAAREYWTENEEHRFYHISTDEVFGSLETGYFTEETPYNPQSPYSSSKASSDHLVRAYSNTFKLPVVISNCSNNYGAFQFPEKLVPLMINNIRNEIALPIYGKGENVRDWLWVEDHARAIDMIFHNGKISETYNIGGNNEWRNIELVEYLCDLMDKKLNRPDGMSKKLITFVKDRAGHDMRYAIDATKVKNELGWSPSVTFEEGLEKTVDWYLDNGSWLAHVTSGSYQDYYKEQYAKR